ncbi:MAG: hypothetical protein ACRDBH_09310 [Bosea sp. (in: a-proteobacteria)]
MASIASTAISMVGAISGGKADKASYDSAAEASRRNAEILKENAAQASREAGSQEDQLRTRQRIFRGNQIASIAQSGIGFEGTGGDLIEQTDINTSLDDLSVRYEGEMKARNLTSQANNATYDAAMQEAAGKRASSSGFYKAIGAGVSGLSSYASFQNQYAPKNTKLSGA